MTDPINTFDAPPTTARGEVRTWLRLDGLAALAAAALAYGVLGGDWRVFALLFLIPDLSMLGYLFGRGFGAFAYNLGHSYMSPLVIGGVTWALGRPDFAPLALIWIAHIGFDRALGYGLKYSTGFGDTHLGRVGRTKPAT